MFDHRRSRPLARRAAALVAVVASTWCVSSALAAPDVKRGARGSTPPSDTRDKVSADARAASSCQALFGVTRHRARRRARRERLLHVVQGRGKRFIIAHGSNHWRYPHPINYRGLQIEALDVAAQSVRVVVAPELARTAKCAAGRYLVAVDDRIGASALLAVLADGLLLEREGYLRYFGASERMPTFWMVWGSRYRVVVNQARAVSSSSRGSRAARTRRKRARKRTVRRRSRRVIRRKR